MARVDIYSPLPEVNQDNFLSILNEITRHPDAIAAHKQWEDIDAQWKDAQKSFASDDEVLLLATKTRIAKESKDMIFDHIARLSEHISNEVGVIEEYDKDTIGKCTAIDNVEELSIDWHNLRRKGLGGSSLSSLLGIHWKSHSGSMVYVDDDELEELWVKSAIEKSTEVIEANVPQSGVLYRGHLIEPALIARYAISRGKRVAVSKATWRGEEEFQVINLDGIILDDDGNPEGILECKTSSRDWTWQWGVPIGYRVQVLWYLRTLGFDYADVAVRFDSGVFSVYRIYADETIDGTSYTYPIEEYVPEIRKRWEKLKRRRDNPMSLWDTDPSLRKEFTQIGGFGVGEKDLKQVVQTCTLKGDTSLIHIEFKAPYERMNDKFTIPVYAHVQNSKGEKLSYQSLRAQKIFYDLDDSDMYIPYKKPIDTLIPGTNVLLCLDTETYMFVIDKFGYDKNVINLSALRRAVDIIPGRNDFSTFDQFFEWYNEKRDEIG